MRQVEKYGKMIWENEKFEDQRNGNCICHQCGRMKPGEPDHCKIASKFYEICKEHGCAFILTRCEDWQPLTGSMEEEVLKGERNKGAKRVKDKLQRLVRFFNRPDTPSFAPDLRVPLWKSILIDWGCLFSLGLWKPN